MCLSKSYMFILFHNYVICVHTPDSHFCNSHIPRYVLRTRCHYKMCETFTLYNIRTVNLSWCFGLHRLVPISAANKPRRLFAEHACWNCFATDMVASDSIVHMFMKESGAAHHQLANNQNARLVVEF